MFKNLTEKKLQVQLKSGNLPFLEYDMAIRYRFLQGVSADIIVTYMKFCLTLPQLNVDSCWSKFVS